MTTAFVLASVGGTVLLLSKKQEWILSSLVVTRFGVDCAYTLTYALTSEVFPPSLSARVFGICTISASIFTIMSPLIAEIHEPVPMLTLVAVCVISTLGSYMLSKQKEGKDIDDA